MYASHQKILSFALYGYKVGTGDKFIIKYGMSFSELNLFRKCKMRIICVDIYDFLWYAKSKIKNLLLTDYKIIIPTKEQKQKCLRSK